MTSVYPGDFVGIRTLLADMFAQHLTTASIANIIRNRAAGIAGFVAAVRGVWAG